MKKTSKDKKKDIRYYLYNIFRLSQPFLLTVNVSTPGCDHIPVLAVKSIDLSKLGD